MTPQLLDVVVLEHDLPAHGLRRGDLGAVVDVLVPRLLLWSLSRHRAAPKRW